MPLVDRRELRKLSRSELKEKLSDVRSKIRRLGEALESEKEALENLRERFRKGDASAEAQLESQQETCKNLRRTLGDERTKRKAMSSVLRQKPDPGAADTARDPHPNYST